MGHAVAYSSSLIPDPLGQQKPPAARYSSIPVLLQSSQAQAASSPEGANIAAEEEAWTGVYLRLQMYPQEHG